MRATPYARSLMRHCVRIFQVTAAKASTSGGGVLQYAPPGQSLDGGNFSAFIMAAMLDSQVLRRCSEQCG